MFVARFSLHSKKKIKTVRHVSKVKSTIYFVGSVYGYSQVENYDSLLAVLRDLSDEDKQQLVQKIQVMIAPICEVQFGKSGFCFFKLCFLCIKFPVIFTVEGKGHSSYL